MTKPLQLHSTLSHYLDHAWLCVENVGMRKLIATVFLSIAICVGSVGMSAAENLQKGLDAFRKGDYEAALNTFRPLAEQGDAGAQLLLGLLYDNGVGVAQDKTKAFKWFRLAAEQGLPAAQYTLGGMYANGSGVSKDTNEQWKWWRLAAEQGFAEAQNKMGLRYQHRDSRKSIKWFLAAAEQEHIEAQYFLGWTFAHGEREVLNNVYAYMWWSIAGAAGDGMAADSLKILEKSMSPSDIAEAQTLTSECVRKNYKDC
jgi:uncharacterized protein